MGWDVVNRIGRMMAWDMVKVIVVMAAISFFVAVVMVLVLTLEAEAQMPTGITVVFSEAVWPARPGNHYVNYNNSAGRVAKLYVGRATDSLSVFYRELSPVFFRCATASFSIPAGNWEDAAENTNAAAELVWDNPDTTPPGVILSLAIPLKPSAAVRQVQPVAVQRRGAWYRER